MYAKTAEGDLVDINNLLTDKQVNQEEMALN